MSKSKHKKTDFRVILQLPIEIEKSLKTVAKNFGLSASQYIRMKLIQDLKINER